MTFEIKGEHGSSILGTTEQIAAAPQPPAPAETVRMTVSWLRGLTTATANPSMGVTPEAIADLIETLTRRLAEVTKKWDDLAGLLREEGFISQEWQARAEKAEARLRQIEECRKFDVKMEGPVPAGWDVSAVMRVLHSWDVVVPESSSEKDDLVDRVAREIAVHTFGPQVRTLAHYSSPSIEEALRRQARIAIDAVDACRGVKSGDRDP